MTVDDSVRDHARQALREEVGRRAWLLFVEQGYDHTTVDEIAAAAGISRRSFFRYFESKDELVLDRLVAAGRQIADALEARPADEAAWPALRAAFQVLVDLTEERRDISRPLQAMVRHEPSLRATLGERSRRWADVLTPLVARRLPARRTRIGPDVRAAAVTASALACLEAAQEQWADHAGASLSRLLDEAMTVVTPLG